MYYLKIENICAYATKRKLSSKEYKRGYKLINLCKDGRKGNCLTIAKYIYGWKKGMSG